MTSIQTIGIHLYITESNKQRILGMMLNLIQHDKLAIAVNRILCLRSFYMLSALALKHGFSTSKHKQLIGWFNKQFVKEEICCVRICENRE